MVGPIFIFGFFISGTVIIINEGVVPHSNKRVAAIEAKWLDKKSKGVFGSEGLWIKNSKGIYNVKKFSSDKKSIEGVTHYEINDDFNVAAKTYADRPIGTARPGLPKKP